MDRADDRPGGRVRRLSAVPQHRADAYRVRPAAAKLANVALWWSALPTEEQEDQRNVDRFVESTEAVLAAENAAWLQEMEQALGDLRDRQVTEDADRSTGSGRTKPAAPGRMAE